VGSDGGVFAFGLPFLGSMGGQKLNASIISIAAPDAGGYWEMGTDGGIFAFGDAPYLGSPGRINPALPAGGTNSFKPSGLVVAFTAVYNNAPGYWEVTGDGSVYAYGSAGFYGSLPSLGVKAPMPISGIASTSDGKGYWLIGQDGSVYAFGDAAFPNNFVGPLITNGSMTNPNGPFATAISSWGGDNASFGVVTNDNRLYPYGSVTTGTSSRFTQVNAAGSFIVGATTTASGIFNPGMWTVSSTGGVFTFGSATFFGSMGGQKLNAPIVSIYGF
jgi:hypothetical protein